MSARAVGHWGSSRTCIATLGTSGTGISVTTSSSNPTLNAPLCEISDNSSLSVTSSGASHPIVANSIGVSGSVSQTGGTVSPTPVTGIVPVSDPLAYLPTPSGGTCLPNPSIVSSSGTVAIPAGDYCTGLSITASATTLNFAPGTYIIGGSGFSVVGSGVTINGTGVTFYMQSGAVSVTPSGSTFNLSAPTSGAYNGILFDQSSSDTSGAQITESGTNSTFEGVLYFPDASFTMTASGSTSDLYLAFVVKSLTLTTSGSAINDYASLSGTTSPIGATALVE